MSDDDKNVPDEPETSDAKPETTDDTAETLEPAEAPEPAETPEPAEAEASPRRRIAWSKVLAFGVLPVVVVLLVAAGGYLTWRQHALSTAETAAAESVQAATDSAIAMLTYEPDAVAEQLVAVRDRLTGDFKDSYAELTDTVVIPGAQQQQISAVASVPSAASVSAEGDRAVVLLFVDQTVTIGAETPTNTKSSVRVNLDKVDGEWLVSDFLPV